MEDSRWCPTTHVILAETPLPYPDNRVILRQLVQLPISKRYCSLSVRMRSAREMRPELDGLSILRADFQRRACVMDAHFFRSCPRDAASWRAA